EAVAGAGIKRVVLAGLANEYIQYFTTPQEYDAQHYEGGSTLYGRLESLVLQFGLSGLAKDLVGGTPAPAAYPYGPAHGLPDDGAGAYSARWEAPLSAPLGRYRFVVTANHYRVVSRAFVVSPSRSLTVTRVSGRGPAQIALAYPAPVTNVDLTARPTRAYGGR